VARATSASSTCGLALELNASVYREAMRRELAGRPPVVVYSLTLGRQMVKELALRDGDLLAFEPAGDNPLEFAVCRDRFRERQRQSERQTERERDRARERERDRARDRARDRDREAETERETERQRQRQEAESESESESEREAGRGRAPFAATAKADARIPQVIVTPAGQQPAHEPLRRKRPVAEVAEVGAGAAAQPLGDRLEQNVTPHFLQNARFKLGAKVGGQIAGADEKAALLLELEGGPTLQAAIYREVVKTGNTTKKAKGGGFKRPPRVVYTISMRKGNIALLRVQACRIFCRRLYQPLGSKTRLQHKNTDGKYGDSPLQSAPKIRL
jgi:hypothetical protein